MPGAPIKALIGADCSQAAEQSKRLFANPEAFVRRVAEILQARQKVTEELLEMADGHWLERDYIPIFVENTYFGHLWKYRDVTERHSQYLELEAIAKEMAALNVLKDKIFSVISHDLRGPHTSLLGVLNLVDEHGLDNADCKVILQRIRPSFERSMRLLEDLLSWSKNQILDVPYSMQEVDVQSFVLNKIERYERDTAAKEIILKSEVLPQATLTTDKQALHTIFRNLLLNAIKFTPRGGQITFCWRENEHKKSLGIRDSGVGMGEDKLAMLVQPNTYLSPTKGTENELGTGIGLLIVRDLAKQIQGELEVESQVGQGSTFWISFAKA